MDMSELTWTKKAPTEDGVYWYKTPCFSEPVLVYIEHDEGTRMVRFTDKGTRMVRFTDRSYPVPIHNIPTNAEWSAGFAPLGLMKKEAEGLLRLLENPEMGIQSWWSCVQLRLAVLSKLRDLPIKTYK